MSQKTTPSQRRGACRPKYISNRKLGISPAKYPIGIQNSIVEFIQFKSDPLRDGILARVCISGVEHWILAHNGAFIGEVIDNTEQTKRRGFVTRLGSVAEGTFVYNLENRPGDGGQLCRSAGSSALVKRVDGDRVTLKMPSKKIKILNYNCLATVGEGAGAGRNLKPFLKAGNKFHAVKNRAVEWPYTSRNSKNVKDHKFGGSGKKRPGSSTCKSKHAPPGAKVGSIGARRTGDK
jgi:large subunit ribosomal protein L2